MKNTIKISAAGSGKTYDICHDALNVVSNGCKKVLIVTYTNRGENAVETEIRKQNKGVLHPQIAIKKSSAFSSMRHKSNICLPFL